MTNVPKLTLALDKSEYRVGDPQTLLVTENIVPKRTWTLDPPGWTQQETSGHVTRFTKVATGTGPQAVTVTMTRTFDGATATETAGWTVVGYLFTVGADNNEGFGNNTLPAFIDAHNLIGPLAIRRSFPSLASWPNTVAADLAAGFCSFVSAGVPGGDYAGTAAGNYDSLITQAVRPLPAGTHVTMNHEPENDVPGATWVKMFRRFYSVAKAANPDVLCGPAHLTYGWRNGVVGNAGNNTGTQSPEAWDVGDDYRDFSTADTYSVRGQALQSDPQFRAWFDFFSSVSDRPLGIAEYGQYAVPPGGRRDPALEAKRAQLIALDAAWLASQPQFTSCWMVWNGSGAQGNWKLQDQASIDAWRTVAALGL